jgi:hypothetical protein
MMAKKGETWNESEAYRDAMTLRVVRQVTTAGLYNQTPTYHTNVGFTADGQFLIFASARGGESAIMCCHVSSGDITQLIDPVVGTGNYSSLHKRATSGLGDGMGVTGHMCIAPRSGWAVYTAGHALRAVHVETLQERTLIADIGAEWVEGTPSVDPDETHVILPVMSAHPEILAGERPTQGYMAHYREDGMRMRLLQVPLSGGAVSGTQR